MWAKRFKTGFTLVEVLVTVGILLVASAVAIPNLARFSQDQELSNTTSDIITLLRQAASNAQSGVKCRGDETSISWSVDFSSIKYFLKAECGDPGDPASVTTIAHSTDKLLGTTKIEFSCGSAGGTIKEYKVKSITYDPAGSIEYPCINQQDLFTIKLTDKNNVKSCISVNSAGVIKEDKTCASFVVAY